MTVSDYLLGLSDLTGELMRFAISGIAHRGGRRKAQNVCAFVRGCKAGELAASTVPLWSLFYLDFSWSYQKIYRIVIPPMISLVNDNILQILNDGHHMFATWRRSNQSPPSRLKKLKMVSPYPYDTLHVSVWIFSTYLRDLIQRPMQSWSEPRSTIYHPKCSTTLLHSPSQTIATRAAKLSGAGEVMTWATMKMLQIEDRE